MRLQLDVRAGSTAASKRGPDLLISCHCHARVVTVLVVLTHGLQMLGLVVFG